MYSIQTESVNKITDSAQRTLVMRGQMKYIYCINISKLAFRNVYAINIL